MSDAKVRAENPIMAASEPVISQKPEQIGFPRMVFQTDYANIGKVPRRQAGNQAVLGPLDINLQKVHYLSTRVFSGKSQEFSKSYRGDRY
jgi:hypothetical protein